MQQQPLGPGLAALGLQQHFQPYPVKAGGLQSYQQAKQGKVAEQTAAKPGPSPATPATGLTICVVCAKPANFLCSGCELVYYCTSACQVRYSMLQRLLACVTCREKAGPLTTTSVWPTRSGNLSERCQEATYPNTNRALSALALMLDISICNLSFCVNLDD